MPARFGGLPPRSCPAPECLSRRAAEFTPGTIERNQYVPRVGRAFKVRPQRATRRFGDRKPLVLANVSREISNRVVAFALRAEPAIKCTSRRLIGRLMGHRRLGEDVARIYRAAHAPLAARRPQAPPAHAGEVLLVRLHTVLVEVIGRHEFVAGDAVVPAGLDPRHASSHGVDTRGCPFAAAAAVCCEPLEAPADAVPGSLARARAVARLRYPPPADLPCLYIHARSVSSPIWKVHKQ